LEEMSRGSERGFAGSAKEETRKRQGRADSELQEEFVKFVKFPERRKDGFG